MNQILESSSILYDSDPKVTIIEEDQEILENYEIAPNTENAALEQCSPWLLWMEINFEKMTEKGTKIDEVARQIERRFKKNINVMHTDINSEKIILRIRLKRDVEETENELVLLKGFENKVINELTIKGFPEIKKVYLNKWKGCTYSKETGGIESVNDKKKESGHEKQVIKTDGCALMKVMTVPSVDHTKVTSNDVIEIFEVLGIEAAWYALIKEIREVLGFYSIYVNYRHISALCDVMT